MYENYCLYLARNPTARPLRMNRSIPRDRAQSQPKSTFLHTTQNNLASLSTYSKGSKTVAPAALSRDWMAMRAFGWVGPSIFCKSIVDNMDDRGVDSQGLGTLQEKRHNLLWWWPMYDCCKNKVKDEFDGFSWNEIFRAKSKHVIKLPSRCRFNTFISPIIYWNVPLHNTHQVVLGLFCVYQGTARDKEDRRLHMFHVSQKPGTENALKELKKMWANIKSMNELDLPR